MKASKMLKGRAGNHTWDTVQPFNGKTTKIDDLTGNFTRLWTVETEGMVLDNSKWGSNSKGLVEVEDTPWKKNGKLNDGFYDRLEKVVDKAEKKDMVTGVVLFDGAFNRFFDQGWENHNLNGYKGLDDVRDVHTLGKHNDAQKAHVKETIKTLADNDNVIFEVANEIDGSGGVAWTKKVIKWVKKFTDKPVGASYITRKDNDWMEDSGADFVAPGGSGSVKGFSDKVTIFDTDHISPLRTNVAGLSNAWDDGRPLWLMDGLDGDVLRNQGSLNSDRAFIDGIT